MGKENSKLELKTNRDGYDIYYKGHIVGNILYDIYTDELYGKRKEAFMAGLQFNQEKNKKLREENKKLQNDLETVGGAYFDR